MCEIGKDGMLGELYYGRLAHREEVLCSERPVYLADLSYHRRETRSSTASGTDCKVAAIARSSEFVPTCAAAGQAELV